MVEKRVNELMNVLPCLYCCSSSLRYRRPSFPEVFGAVWVMLTPKGTFPCWDGLICVRLLKCSRERERT